MKILNNNIKKNPKIIPLNNQIGDLGVGKYLPSYSKEWNNIIYSYNKNTLKNIPSNTLNVNKIIQSYFNLYFKNQKFIGSKKFVLLKRRRNFLRRIYVSNAEIKHTNNKAIITLFNVNREKKILQKKYLKINKKISNTLIQRYFLLYKKNILKIFNILKEYKDKYIFLSDKINKRKFLQYKFQYLNKFIVLKNLYLKKVWSIIIKNYGRTNLNLLRKYELMYSLNQSKFNKLSFLPILTNILTKIIGKKIQYNIVNLKSITFHSDIFTQALAIKLKKKRANSMKNMYSILNRASLASSLFNVRKTNILNKYKDLRFISYIDDQEKTLNTLLNNENTLTNNTNKDIYKNIFHSIGYKNMAGIRLEIKGRLTKRYRADRSISILKWKGGLKNRDSSFQGLSSVLFRGNTKSNVSYSLATNKRRVGSFAVKGWIAGK